MLKILKWILIELIILRKNRLSQTYWLHLHIRSSQPQLVWLTAWVTPALTLCQSLNIHFCAFEDAVSSLWRALFSTPWVALSHLVSAYMSFRETLWPTKLSIGLAEKFIQVFCKMVWKNPNDFFFCKSSSCLLLPHYSLFQIIASLGHASVCDYFPYLFTDLQAPWKEAIMSILFMVVSQHLAQCLHQ